MPLSEFSRCADDGDLSAMYVCGSGKITPEVVNAFQDIYYRFYDEMDSHSEFLGLYRKYSYHYVKEMVLACALTLKERGLLNGSETEKQLKKYMVNAATIESARSQNLLMLTRAQKKLEEYIKEKPKGSERITDGVPWMSDYLGYQLKDLTVAEYCGYMKIIREKDKRLKSQNNGNRKNR